MSSAAQASPQTLFRWIWRSYARTALVPLLAVELLLIGAYFSTNLLTKNANIASIRATAEQSLQEVARLNAAAVDEKLVAVRGLAEVLRQQVREVQFADPPPPAPSDEAGRFTFDPTGVVYYTREDVGRGAGFYSGVVPVTPEMQDKAVRLAAVDPILRDITRANPLVVQSYYNTWDSYNRIYPFFDTLSQYAPRLDIPSFNFYYEADAAHNPDRAVVWTDAYVDPAGQGWLISAIAPVYGGDALEGVVGLDITIDTIVERILDIRTPWGGYAVMVGRDGTILAMPPAAEDSLGLREVGKHSYEEAIRANTFKPEDYSLARIADLSGLPVMDGQGSGAATLLGEPHLVAWQSVPATDWHLIVFVPERDLFAAAVAVGDRFDRLGYAMVAALVVFYALFFTVLWFSARRHARSLARPLEAVAVAAGRIAHGDFRQTLPPSSIREVAAVGQAVVEMGGELGDKTARLLATSRSLEESDAFRRALIENLPVPVVLYRAGDPDVVIAHNSAYDALVAEVGHTQIRDALVASDGGETEEGTLALTLGDPPRRYSGRFTRLAHGGERGVLCVLLDVTVLEEARRQIAQARDRALEAARVKSEFLAKASHELRTPLNGIIGLAEVCSHEADPARMQRSIAMIAQSGQALLGLVEDLLTMSSLDTGTLVLDRRWVVPGSLLDDLVEGFRPTAEERGLTLALLPGPGLQLRVLAAGQQVRQVVTHLVANALKFTARGSVAVVADVVGGGGDDAAAVLTVVVEDTGIGLPEGPLEALFEPFHQGENGLDRRYGGFGLGLAVARDLAERMGGSLTAQRRSPSGSRFTLMVPVSVDTGAADRPLPPVARALLCGFDRTTEALLVAILGKLDLPVDTAAAGEASRLLSPRGDDLVILPALTAADVDGLRRLLTAHADLRVLAVTDPTADDLTERLKRLAIPMLPLPITPRGVEAVVEPFRLPAPSDT